MTGRLPGQYGFRDSPIHRASPFLKLVAALSLGPVILLCGEPMPLASLSLALGALLFLAKGPTWRSLAGLWPTSLFLAAILGYHLLTGDVVTGLLVTWQFLLLVILSLLFTFTTSPRQIVAALQRLFRPLPLRPLGLSPRDLSLMLILAIRFFPLFFEELERLRKAQRIRAFQPRRAGLRRGTRILVSLATNLLSGMFRRAEEVSRALLARGYRPGPGPLRESARPTSHLRG